MRAGSQSRRVIHNYLHVGVRVVTIGMCFASLVSFTWYLTYIYRFNCLLKPELALSFCALSEAMICSINSRLLYFVLEQKTERRLSGAFTCKWFVLYVRAQLKISKGEWFQVQLVSPQQKGTGRTSARTHNVTHGDFDVLHHVSDVLGFVNC